MITIRLCGAAGEVTGSGYLVQGPQSQVLVDFGLFQGGVDARRRSREFGPVVPRGVNAAILTHAHIDHSGRLPMLTAAGWRGPLFATHATLALTPILLEDVARLDLEWVGKLNRARERAGEELLEPIYRPEDVERLHDRGRALNYGQRASVAAGMSLRLLEAGHIMGSASVELTVEDGDRPRVIVFSGDVGPPGVPILRDPEPPSRADLVFLESTYGGRERPPQAQTVAAFKDVIEHAARHGERVIIPAFAVGRAQLILYYLAEAVREGRLPRDFPIYLDSPMAARATAALVEHPEVLDTEAAELVARRQFAADLRSLRVTASAAESRALNAGDHPCIILSASGMCEGGRVVHHLRHNLWKRDVHVLLVGYMARDTLGRELADGAREVMIFGEKVLVRAAVHRLDGFSAHAGHGELLDWLARVAPAMPRVVLTHGEDPARAALAAGIATRYGITAEMPVLEAPITLD